MSVCGMPDAALKVPDALERQNNVVSKMPCTPERLKNPGRPEK